MGRCRQANGCKNRLMITSCKSDAASGPCGRFATLERRMQFDQTGSFLFPRAVLAINDKSSLMRLLDLDTSFPDDFAEATDIIL